MTIDIAPALRVLGICALIGALTTLLNTVAPSFYSASDFDSRMALIHNPMYAVRQWVLRYLAAVGIPEAAVFREQVRCLAADSRY